MNLLCRLGLHLHLTERWMEGDPFARCWRVRLCKSCEIEFWRPWRATRPSWQFGLGITVLLFLASLGLTSGERDWLRFDIVYALVSGVVMTLILQKFNT